MPLLIQTNVASLESQRNLSRSQASLAKSFNRLSSGFRINSAADDAAGLAISEGMKMQIRSYTVAERNANDGISMAQTAEGALGEVTSILSRLRELAMQGSNGSYTSADRNYMNTEYRALCREIDRIQKSTKFNQHPLIQNASAVSITFQVGLHNNSDDQIPIQFNGLNLSTLLNSTTVSGGGTTASLAALSVIDNALTIISTKRAEFGAAMNRFESTISIIQTMRLNLNAANSRIRDVDVAEETSVMAKNQVLTQAGTAVLAQANQIPQTALSLLKG